MDKSLKSLNIFSLHTRILGDKKKRHAVFTWSKGKGPGIFLIQESHSHPEKESEWRSMWDGTIEFSHGTLNSRGLAILISHDIDINIDNIETDISGRILILKGTVPDLNLVIVNIYARTVDKRLDQVTCANTLCDTLEKYNGDNIILGGDWNISIDTLSPDVLSTKNPDYSNKLSQIIEAHNLVDIWRIQHPGYIRYTC